METLNFKSSKYQLPLATCFEYWYLENRPIKTFDAVFQRRRKFEAYQPIVPPPFSVVSLADTTSRVALR